MTDTAATIAESTVKAVHIDGLVSSTITIKFRFDLPFINRFFEYTCFVLG